MTKAEIKMRANLINLIQKMDAALLQRVSDFTQGLLAASDERKEDWWDELPADEKAELKESVLQGESGQEKPMEEVFKKYGVK